MSSWEKEPLIQIVSAPLGDRWSDQLCHSYLEQIPVSFHSKLNAYRHWADKQRSLIGRLLLAKILHRYHFPESTLEQVKIGRYGKPAIGPGFSFNIAHSFDRIVCVGSRIVDVGIDIEWIRPIDFSDFESVMSPAQWQHITHSPEPVTEFWRHWTVKEAIAKADGRGIGLPLATISIESTTATLDHQHWHVAKLDYWAGYCSYLATNRQIEPALIDVEEYHFG
ncbi:hypothetical protein GCM10028803_33670 [Larkinella knui]|uniref:4'-phosphopantetheinyl transferase superfamily protein n=1 Tax=Larkinella knui TaxID=2025310 RepID=A0A3P1C8S1_9BACT|nr:4'-phosphopantetheinyl transferase superfamily protein [Larkinella knui]RRB09657.1 4'-phosphopantetheinyl transferase superfamily protein [Larkinella knui]